MSFYLAGHDNFGNRGCEALVRSIAGLVRTQLPQARFSVPSVAPALDAPQWPEMGLDGAALVAPSRMPGSIKWWNRAVSRVPALLSMWEPRYSLPAALQATIDGSSAVVMTGGDVISLDYAFGDLFRWSGFIDAAARSGCPTMLFAASVGPFSAHPVVERHMQNHLKRYSIITVRESASLQYLRRLGLEQAVLVADPAFCLVPEAVEPGAPYTDPGDGVLAFNVSPLVARGWQRQNPGLSLIEECAAFIRRVLAQTGLSVALLPHVDPLDGASENSDSAYMTDLLTALGGPQRRLALVRRGLNAAQIKYLVGRSRYLIAARTHATVAGWSQHVPTVSIAYSIKARGLNQDLFDSLDHVLDTPKVDRDTLWASYERLASREADIRSLLQERIPQWRAKAAHSAELLAGIAR